MSYVSGSLVRARTLAPLLMAVTGVVTIVQFLLLMHGELVPVMGAFAIPTIGTTTLGWLLARKKWGAVLMALLFIPITHALAVALFGALASSGDKDLALAALIVDAVTAALAFPALIACAVHGPRPDHDAGDVLLAFGGGWFALEQGLCFALAGGKPEGWMFGAVALASLVTMTVAIVRIVRRRAFVKRVAAGLVNGWRVRTDAPPDAASDLVPLFGGHTALAILERFDVATTPYRSAPIAEPVALVPAL